MQLLIATFIHYYPKLENKISYGTLITVHPHYSAIKDSKLHKHVTTWMTLKSRMLSEAKQDIQGHPLLYSFFNNTLLKTNSQRYADRYQTCGCTEYGLRKGMMTKAQEETFKKSIGGNNMYAVFLVLFYLYQLYCR